MRQARYAGWITEAVARHARVSPRRVLDVGCGNGSLLLALASAWPDAELLGCDPSAEAIAHAGAGVRVWRGTSATLAAGLADLVIAVNVIEHTTDPAAFLTDLRRACAPGGTVVVVCPDGSRPGIELLFADHLHSFAASHLRAFAGRAGLTAVATLAAPAPLGEFQMLVAAAAAPGESRIVVESPQALNGRRAALLGRWAALDARLEGRVPPGAVCFGIGEAAGLLRAYAPRTWTRIRACTADPRALNPAPPAFGGLPIVPLEALPRETPILVGVRPLDQAAVAARLAGQFATVATWYDLVDVSA
jgi:SAM-dependent methyltransferase